MRRTGIFFIVAVMFCMTASCVISGTGPLYTDAPPYYQEDSFYKRIENQQRRINDGITSGELTRKEAALLQDNLNWIRDRYQRMKADGVLTKAERERLDLMLDRNSDMIKDKRHNAVRQLYGDDIQSRIDNQQERINQGITSGKLTRHEADIVQDNLNDIRKRYSKMVKDGILTAKELAKLDRMLDENSKMIHEKESNRNYKIKRLY